MEEQYLQETKIINNDGEVSITAIENLTPEQKNKYQPLIKDLDYKNPNSVINFGSELQKSLAGQSDAFLKNVRKSNSGEVGALINDLLVELNYVNVDDLEAKGLKRLVQNIPLLKRLVTNVDNLFTKYDTIIKNIEGISRKVNVGIINSTKDNAVLQTVFEGNVKNVHLLEDYIIAGAIKYEETLNELTHMENNPDQFPDFEIADKRDFANRIDRRLADLKVVRMIMLQSLPQIRLVQKNNESIADKAQTILTQTLPVWKNQLTLAVAMHRQKQNIEVQQKVQETTESILRKNAERLGQNSRDVARANEQTIVSAETLKETQRLLIETLNDVKQIQEEGTQKRRELDSELSALETELRNNIKK